MTAHNPILPGFRPDPSIVRVRGRDGDEYIIATSTFEWFPGVELHRSRDLLHWEILPGPLSRQSQLDMVGNPDSGGVWAPCLSHDGRQFYLVFTDVKHHGSIFSDTHNYVVTAESIEGPWSDPVHLNSYGADPSLFHDADGRKWLVVTNAEYRPGLNPFGGIILQEVDADTLHPREAGRLIFRGTELGCTEGPHLYRRGGYYYLLTAEGGTFYDHAVTVARSRHIHGPYEVHPQNPILTSADTPDALLQRAGHGDLVETPEGDWYLVHLVSRLLEGHRRSILGRETAMQEILWHHDDWPRLRAGGRSPRPDVSVPSVEDVGARREPAAPSSPRVGAPISPRVGAPLVRIFDGAVLPPELKTLRRGAEPSWCDLVSRPGYLRLHGGESLSSRFRQSMVARRREHFECRAWTLLEMRPDSPKHSAGLICYYNTSAYHYLYVTSDDSGSARLAVLSKTAAGFAFPIGAGERSPAAEAAPTPGASSSPEGAVRMLLGLEGDHSRLQFYAAPASDTQVADPRPPAAEWRPVGPVLDASDLSDEGVPGGGFTGTFLGVCCQDLRRRGGRGSPADFRLFGYSPGRWT